MKNLDNVTNVWGKVDERRHEVLEVSVQGMRNRWPLGFPLVKFRNAAGEEYAHSFKDDMKSNKVRVELNDRDVKRAGVCVMTVEWHEKGRVVASREYMGLIEGKKMEKPKYEVIGGKEDCAGGNGGGGLPEGGEPYKQLVTDASGKTVWEDRLAWKGSGTILDEKVPEVTVDFADGYFYEDYYSKSPENTDLLSRMEFYDATENIIAYWDGVFYKCHFSETLGSGSGAEDKYVPEGTDAFFFTVVAAAAPVVICSKDNGVHTFRLGIGGSTEVVHTILPEYIGGWKSLGESVPVETEIVASQTLTYADSGDSSGMGVVQNPFALDLKDGSTYKVTWDGTEYESVAYAVEQVVCIGNGDFLGLTGYGNNEPYFFYSGAGMVAGACSEAGEHTVKIVGMVSDIIPCPREYLPENLCESVVVDFTKPITTDEALTLLTDAKSGKALFYTIDGSVYHPLFEISGYPTTHLYLYDGPNHYLTYRPTDGVYNWSESTETYTDLHASSFVVNAQNSAGGLAIENTYTSGIGGGKAVYVRSVNGGDYDTIIMEKGMYFSLNNLVLYSSTEGSSKKFLIKVDDSGTLSATEVT